MSATNVTVTVPAGSNGRALATSTAPEPDAIAELSDRIRVALECPVCMEVKADIECYCPNGHVICSMCLTQLCMRDTVETNCPMCRAPMSPNSGGQLTAARMSLVLPMLYLTCRYRKFGCNVIERVPEVARHEADCRYWPDVRCLVTGCSWLGTRDMLYEHVSRVHPRAVARTQGNRLLVTDVNCVTSSERRTYLVRTDGGDRLLWVLMSRESRNRMRAGVFVVESMAGRRHRDTADRPTDLSYRITFMGGGVGGTDTHSHRRHTQSRTCRVGRWHSSLQAADGRDDKAESYTRFQSRGGVVEFRWFERVSFARDHVRTRTVSRRRVRRDAVPVPAAAAGAPAPTVPTPNVPTTTVPTTTVPTPTVPTPTVPTPTVPTPTVLIPTVPEPTVPEPTVPEPIAAAADLARGHITTVIYIRGYESERS